MNNNKLKTSCSKLILEASTGYSFVSHRTKNSIHTKNHITQETEIDMDAIFTAPKNSQKQRQPFVMRPIMSSEKKNIYIPFPPIAERFKFSYPESKLEETP